MICLSTFEQSFSCNEGKEYMARFAVKYSAMASFGNIKQLWEVIVSEM